MRVDRARGRETATEGEPIQWRPEHLLLFVPVTYQIFLVKTTHRTCATGVQALTVVYQILKEVVMNENFYLHYSK